MERQNTTSVTRTSGPGSHNILDMCAAARGSGRSGTRSSECGREEAIRMDLSAAAPNRRAAPVESLESMASRPFRAFRLPRDRKASAHADAPPCADSVGLTSACGTAGVGLGAHRPPGALAADLRDEPQRVAGPCRPSQAAARVLPNCATAILGLLVLLSVPTDVHAQSRPQFGKASYTFTVTENFATGQRPAVTIGTVTATQSGQTITYSLEGSDRGRFTIDRNTGVLTTKAGKAISNEHKPLYAVWVKATGVNSSRASVHIWVPNVRRTASRSIQETYGHEREKTARDIGAPIPAVTGTTSETFSYSIEGEWGEVFQVDASSGQLKTIAGRVAYNYEAWKSSFYLRVTDSDGISDLISVTVNLTDIDEPPREVAGPCSTLKTTTSLTVKWGTGHFFGYPRTESYDLRYRRGGAGSWTNAEQGIPRTRPHSTISNLDPNTYYEVAIRGTNHEGTGVWSTGNCSRRFSTTLPPQLSVSDAQATEGTDGSLDFVVTLAPAAVGRVTVDYATSDGTATSGNDYTAKEGTLTFMAGETTKTITVPIIDDTVEDDGETVNLVLSNPSGAELDRSEAVGTIRNTESDPLTAAFSSVPASHDGKTAFTFTLTFSEDFRGLSYKTLKNSAFDVTGGSVTKAKRQTPGSNVSWNITVKPDSYGTVTIRLPQTTDCDATGAICTRDGRMLSNSVSDTVPVAASASADDAGNDVDAADDALAVAGGVTPDDAAAALFGERTLSEARLAALDRLGNRNGRYDLGDLLSWIARCRRDEGHCGTVSTDSRLVSSAALLAAAATRHRGTSRRPRRRESRSRGRSPIRGLRRRSGMAGYALAMLLAATMAWSCTYDLVGPAAANAEPGFLTVELAAPVANHDIGVLLQLEGPGIETVRAPGLELYQSSAPGPRQIVVAGALRSGALVEFRVPDRGQLPLYRVRVVQVTGEDYALRDPGEYRAVIKLN